MDDRYATRKQQILAECKVKPEVFDSMVERLSEFAQPFVKQFAVPEQKQHAEHLLSGLASGLEYKNAESIAYLFDEDRQGLQRFVGVVPWEIAPLLGELARQVGAELGEADGIIVFDPSGFAKKGTASVGVARQWLGRLGKVDNGQVGVFMGYVSRQEHALVDMRLYLPKAWAADKKRRQKCHVPKDIRFQTRHDLALDMLREKRDLLPHGWVAGDDEMGRSSPFRRDLRELAETYLLAVPSNTTIRDLDAPPPEYHGRGAKPKRPFQQVRAWCAALPASAWTRIDVRDGTKGPLLVEAVSVRVEAKTDRRVGPEETLVVLRSNDEQGAVKHDYYLSNAAADTPLAEFARVALGEHRIEECIKRAKSEAGLADYEVRSWWGWHHHVGLSLIAAWFLLKETRRGKNLDPRAHRAASPRRAGRAAA